MNNLYIDTVYAYGWDKEENNIIFEHVLICGDDIGENNNII